MTDVTTYPMIDDFDTTLAQARDGGTGTVYLNEATGVTLPASTTTYIVVNPGKSTMQVAKINAVDNTAKTVTVSSISVDKGAGVSYTQQSHPVGSIVRISTNYAFWKDIVDGINSKVDTNSNDVLIYKYADATARDAALTSPTNGMQVYLATEGKRTDYIAGSRQDRDQGTVTANASTTVAGKVEIATTAQITAGTATGDTGALLVSTPAGQAAQIQSGTWVYGADAGGDDTYVVALTPTLSAYTTGQSLYAKVTTANTGACSFDFGPGAKNVKTLDGNDPQTGAIRAGMIVHLKYDGTNLILQNEDFATTANKGIVEMATDAEAKEGTDETRYVNSKQLKGWAGYTLLPSIYTTVAFNTTIPYGPVIGYTNTSESADSATYVKLKEVVVTGCGGTVSVVFSIKHSNSGGGTSYGKIYKNGSAVGTERTSSVYNTSYYFYDNITVASGDLIQLYVKGSSYGGAYGCGSDYLGIHAHILPSSCVFTTNDA